MLRISNVKMPLSHEEKDLVNKVTKILKINNNDIKEFTIFKKSLDARDKNNINYIYSVDILIDKENLYLNKKNIKQIKPIIYKTSKISLGQNKRPIVVGFGPAGIFASLILAEAGLNPIVIERGKDVYERQIDVNNFWHNGILNSESNVQFGEGGAGTFSDGKLTTGIKDDRIYKVLDEFLIHGAPSEIKYLQKPHVGTDMLINILISIRKKIQSLGGEIYFSTKLTNIHYSNNKIVSIDVENNNSTKNIETDNLILALGHSARDTFKMLFDKKINITQKPFAVGLRIEHLQKEINKSQYGAFHNKLPASEYKLSHHGKNSKGVFTFCMCPGGVVVGATSSNNQLVTNGMSQHARDGINSNAGLLVGVNSKDFSSTHPLAGITFQESLEKNAFILGGSNYKAPVQLLGDFINNKTSSSLGDIEPTFSNGYNFSNLQELFTKDIINAIIESISVFDKKLVGFNKYDSVLTGVESRSSSPIRILRNHKLQSNISGLYPCGEGAGYAGGIMSAAVDGIKCGEMIINYMKKANTNI